MWSEGAAPTPRPSGRPAGAGDLAARAACRLISGRASKITDVPVVCRALRQQSGRHISTAAAKNWAEALGVTAEGRDKNKWKEEKLSGRIKQTESVR
ncbi:hypothetical protein EYF80_013600 [Liparis tanakae]|uniref:Uncharacterized protein n=1 Tax=Liparis tanakae TaxID=230148 RepID=A0A4Z2IDA5_9TELE|nr:hypothetical protein EYF80_013600 [Liparis tanakae]